MLSLLVLSIARGHSSGGMSHDANCNGGDVLEKIVVERVSGGGATGAANSLSIRRRIVHMGRPRD
jgi:hypothetical protein